MIALIDKNTIYVLGDGSTQKFRIEEVLPLAEDRFRKATEFDPKNYLYFANLAATLYRQKKYEEALEAVLKAVELNPDNPQLQEYEAVIRREKITVYIEDEPENK